MKDRVKLVEAGRCPLSIRKIRAASSQALDNRTPWQVHEEGLDTLTRAA